MALDYDKEVRFTCVVKVFDSPWRRSLRDDNRNTLPWITVGGARTRNSMQLDRHPSWLFYKGPHVATKVFGNME